MQPLTDSFEGKPRGFNLAPEAVEAANQLKDKPAQASTSTYPNSNFLLILVVDTLDKLESSVSN